MEPYTRNGGMIGVPMSFTSEDSYVIGTTPGLATIEFVGGRVQSGTGTTSNITVSLTGLTGGLASSASEGDIVIVSLVIASSADRSYRISDFTEIADLYANDTEEVNLQVGYKIMGATPDTSFTVTDGTGSASDAYSIAIHVYRNVDQTTPFDVTSTTVTQTDTGIPNPPAITPVTSGAIIVVTAGTAHTGGTDTFSASYLSNFITSGANDDNDSTVGMGNIAWTSGTYDPAAWTFSQTNSTAFSTASVTMALRPATIDVDILGNKKNSGIWDLYSAFVYPTNVPISFVGLTSAVASTVALPSHETGDLILVMAQAESLTIPSLPDGFTNIQDGSANADDNWAWRVGYKFATSASDSIGTWTNATRVAAGVYRGVASIGASNETVANTTTPTWAALTLENTNNTSWVVGVLAHERDLVSATGVPYTTRLNQSYRTWWDTNATVSSFTSVSATLANGGRGTTTMAIELKD